MLEKWSSMEIFLCGKEVGDTKYIVVLIDHGASISEDSLGWLGKWKGIFRDSGVVGSAEEKVYTCGDSESLKYLVEKYSQ